MQDDEGTPAITYGLRGIAYWDVKVFGPFQDIHSGQFGGGVDNPATVLVQMLGSLTDGHGRVTIPGFYDRVREMTVRSTPPTPRCPSTRPTGPSESRSADRWTARPGYTLLERLSARPTFDVNGLWGGYPGEGSKTIIPAFAGAKISCRLVPDQDHHEIEQLMIDHLQRIAPPTVRVEVKVIQGGQPAITPLDHPALVIAARALEETFGKAPVFHRTGGSIPVVAAMERELGLPSIMIGFASPNGNFHAPNEWMPLANYRGGMDALVRLWDELGAVSAAELRRADGRGRAPTIPGWRSARPAGWSAWRRTRCGAGPTPGGWRASSRRAAIAASCGRRSRR